MTTFQKIYLLSLGLSLLLIIVRMKYWNNELKGSDHKFNMMLIFILCIIPIVNIIWLIALLAALKEKEKNEVKGKYHLMKSEEHKMLFIYNESQKENDDLCTNRYDCLSSNYNINELITQGQIISKMDKLKFNEKYLPN